MADLKDRIVLVAGAAGAIGAAVTAAIKHAGGTAIATDLAGADATLDVTAEADWQRIAADIERQHGRLDGLVNAAGIVTLGSVEQLDFATCGVCLPSISTALFSAANIRSRCCVRTAARSSTCPRSRA
ncbi:MAG: hypothetical protein ABSF41_14660 [Pseudolabrys sp.]|jgi:NAD(P)-dependent dehydrogenase (short-subunit alcohol dehydrogenase family)